MSRRDPNTEDDNQYVDYDENEHNQFLTQDCTSASYRLGNIAENVSGSDQESPSDPEVQYLNPEPYTPINYPTLDFRKAKYNIDEALVAFINTETFHDQKLEVDFSIKGFSILSVTFRTLHIDEQTMFFNVLTSLKDSLTAALTSCLHYSLLRLVCEKKWFWPEIASAIGITPPTRKPAMTFGQHSLYYLGHPHLRATTSRDIDDKARQHEQEFEQILLKSSSIDCTKWRAAFKQQFTKRFDSNLDNTIWVETATGDTISSQCWS
jgi:hypothetical protein